MSSVIHMREKKKNRILSAPINARNIIVFFLLLVFTKPRVVDYIDSLDLLFNAAIFGGSLALVIYYFSRGKLNKRYLTLMLIFIIVLFSTIIRSGYYSKTLSHYVPALGFLAFAILNKKHLNEIVGIFLDFCIVLLTINILTVIIYPNGLLTYGVRAMWLLGSKQDMGGYVLQALFAAAIMKEKQRAKWRLTVILSIITAGLFMSIGLLLCLTVFLLLCLFDKHIKNLKPKMYILLVAVCFVGVIGLTYLFEDMSSLQSLLGNINTVGQSKIYTIRARTTMWGAALNILKKSPIIGAGNLTEDVWSSMTGVNVYYAAIDNLYFDILLTGGILALILFLYLVFTNFKNYKSLWKSNCSRVCCYCTFALCLLNFEICGYSAYALGILVFSSYLEKALSASNNIDIRKV